MKKTTAIFIASLLSSFTVLATQQITLEPGASATLHVNEETIVQCRGGVQSTLPKCKIMDSRYGGVNIYVNDMILRHNVAPEWAVEFVQKLREISQCQ